MKAIRRRDLYAPLSALAGVDRAQATQLSISEVLSPDRLPVVTNANGGKRWDILHGVLATGEAIAVHESMQPAGMSPNAPHTIQHSELILVQEGTLLFEHDDRSEEVSAGGVIFVAFGTKHSARNVGNGPAKYLVIAIGGDTQ